MPWILHKITYSGIPYAMICRCYPQMKFKFLLKKNYDRDRAEWFEWGHRSSKSSCYLLLQLLNSVSNSGFSYQKVNQRFTQPHSMYPKIKYPSEDKEKLTFWQICLQCSISWTNSESRQASSNRNKNVIRPTLIYNVQSRIEWIDVT